MTDTAPSFDDLLDRAINAITSQTVPNFARQQSIERAIAARVIPLRAPARPISRFWATIIQCGVAACLFIVVGLILLPALSKARSQSAMKIAKDLSPQANEHEPDTRAAAAYKVRSNIQILIAEQAPILIANGPAAPFQLGAELPEKKVTGALHIWNWSKSTTSRIVPGIEFWPSDHAAISPDGTFLIKADGTTFDLTGNPKQPAILPKIINLGGADYHEGPATYTRIGEMRFSPDGQRLAMLVTLRNEDKTVHEVIQIIEFPTGKLLCEFPAGEAYALRIALSADGKQVVAADPQRKIALRQCSTGKVLREFDPPLKSQVMSIAISPDGKQIAASDRGGELIVWNADTGKILWQADNAKLAQSPGSEAMELLRFSPGNQFLAGRRWGKVNVFDAATGHLEGSITALSSSALRWSDDSKFITIVTAERNSSKRNEPPTAIYPTVQQFDWRTGKANAAP